MTKSGHTVDMVALVLLDKLGGSQLYRGDGSRVKSEPPKRMFSGILYPYFCQSVISNPSSTMSAPPS